jgi:PAS domain S-box-containing protein
MVVDETLARAVDQNADSVVITNGDGVIEYVNPAFEAVTGFDREEAIGQKPNLVRSGVATDQFYQTLWGTILSGRTFRTTITNRRRDGHLYEYEQTITPLRDAEGEVTHFLSTGRDVTARQLDAAARRIQQLEHEGARVARLLHDEAGQFLALAHITLAGLVPGLSPAYADRIEEVRRYLTYVEERLREGTRGVQPPMLADLGLVDAIKFLAHQYERRLGAPIVVESSLDRSCPATLEVLLYRFVQEALLNLSRHAQATCGTILLERRAGGRRAADTVIACSIRDDGVGFDPSKLAGSANRSRGLRALQSQLEAVGGTLTIVSGPKGGTEVRATVPVESAAS